jgi:DNA repair photolyase
VSRPHGRATATNPRNRFEPLALERDAWSEDDPALQTEFLSDTTRSLITYNDSPDVGFDASINPYRGCEHGCVYCFARPNHEYLGMSAGLDFESRILVKRDAPDILTRELSHRKWTPQPIAISGVTDAWQPVERRLGLTRRCLEVLAEFHNPAVVITKSDLIARDADLLGEMARWGGAVVFVSVTTLDPELAGTMEPRAAAPAKRLEAISRLASAGVPVGVLAAPMIAGLTDHELPSILARAAQAGARFAGYIPLRLPFGVSELFEDWLERNAPLRKAKVLSHIRSLRGGKLNDARFGHRMRGQGAYAGEMRDLFRIAARKSGLDTSPPSLSVDGFRVPRGQASLFDDR